MSGWLDTALAIASSRPRAGAEAGAETGADAPALCAYASQGAAASTASARNFLSSIVYLIEFQESASIDDYRFGAAGLSVALLEKEDRDDGDRGDKRGDREHVAHRRHE